LLLLLLLSSNIDFNEFNKEFTVSTQLWNSEKSFLIQSNNEEIKLIQKIDQGFDKLETFAEMFSGIKCYEVGKGNPPQTPQIRDEKPFTKEYQVDNNWLPFFEGKHVDRYQLSWNQNSWINYGNWLAAPREKENFIDEKILIRKIVGSTLICNYVPYTSYCNTLLFVLKLAPQSKTNYQSLLGILNSKFIGWYYRHKFQISDDDTFPQIMIRDILKFPIPNNNSIEIENQVSFLMEKMSHFQNLKNKFIGLVQDNYTLTSISKKVDTFYKSDFKNFLSELKKQKVALSLSDQSEWKDFFETTKTEIIQLQSKIEETDKEIDQMVYELYGLTEEEIKIVENS
jgi:TaqI-like C-terminal specificity domain